MTADVYENVDAVEKGSPNYGLGLKIIETKKKKARKMKIMEASSSSMFKRKLIYRELWVSIKGEDSLLFTSQFPIMQ